MEAGGSRSSSSTVGGALSCSEGPYMRENISEFSVNSAEIASLHLKISKIVENLTIDILHTER